jgi:uncharacterized protein (DUF488 family)
MMSTPTIFTIGYESATVASFQDALRRAKVDLLIDVRAVASSRRPGFAKTALAANAKDAGAEYLHLRALGTPADGRVAARAGRPDEMKRIYRTQLATADAQEQLALVVDLVKQGRRVCLLCLEADARICHRSLVAAAVAKKVPATIANLEAKTEED